MSARVVVSLLTDGQEFQRMQASDARAAGARCGLDVGVEFAENSAIVQIQQVFRHVHAPEGSRPVAIVAEAVGGDALERVARNAVAAGIDWVLLNWRVPYVGSLRATQQQVAVASVAADEVEIGRIQARQCRALVPRGGLLLCIQGPPETTTAAGRLDGLRSGLGPRFELNLLNGDWTESSGYKAMASLLRLRSSEARKPSGIVAQNDAMAAGARRAVLAAHPDWDDVPFVGCDGLPEGGQRLVERGEIAATVVKPTTTGAAVELIARALRVREAGLRFEATDLVLAPRSFPPEGRLGPAAARPAPANT